MGITDLIEKSGKRRAEIVEQVGISQGYLSLIEAGKRKIGKNRVCALANELGVHPSELRPDLAALFTPSSAPDTEDS